MCSNSIRLNREYSTFLLLPITFVTFILKFPYHAATDGSVTKFFESVKLQNFPFNLFETCDRLSCWIVYLLAVNVNVVVRHCHALQCFMRHESVHVALHTASRVGPCCPSYYVTSRSTLPFTLRHESVHATPSHSVTSLSTLPLHTASRVGPHCPFTRSKPNLQIPCV